MKKITLLAFVILPLFMLAQKTNKIEINSKINGITVYIDGAEISRTQNVNLKEGRNLLVFKNISKKLLRNSIRVSTDNEISILSISSKLDFLNSGKENPKTKQLKDSLNLILKQIKDLEDFSDAYKIEKEMLLKNTSLGGSNTGVKVDELKAASDFYRKKVIEINNEQTVISRKISKLEKSQTKIAEQLLELNANTGNKVAEILVLLTSAKAKNSKVEIKYLVSGAGWAPSYDLKVADIDKDIDLTYRAQVFNNTSVEWKNIKLKLSSGDPSISAESPILKPWYLNYVTNSYNYNNSFKRSEGYTQNMNFSNMAQQSDDFEVGGLDSDITGGEEYKEVEVSELSVEFDIKEPYSIPSDNKPYYVDVAKYQLPATYKHFCVPKMDRDVFLLAQITGWQNLNLVEGPAHIYFAGTYVGKSYIYTRNVRDTLDLSLGRDKKVLVTRSKLKDFSSVKFIGSKRKETLAYQMVIKNNRNAPISIEVQDQIPISKNSDIEVDVIEISDADQDENTGKLSWEYNLPKGGNKKIDLKFSIKYPKSSTIQIEQSRKKMMRKF